jgi:hypothetical protein
MQPSTVTHPARGRFGYVAIALTVLTVLTAVVGLPTSAGAIDTTPRQMYDAWSTGNGIQVSGTYTPVVGNFAGDRADDILWYAPGPAQDHLWIANGRGTFVKEPITINGTYTPVVGDFAGDPWDDILWYAPGTAADSLWISVSSTTRFSKSGVAINATYTPVVLEGSLDWAIARLGLTGPFPRDSILWYRPGAGADYLWQWPIPQQATPPTPNSMPANIPGSPQLIPAELNGDQIHDLIAYTPGPGGDALYRYDTGVLVPTAKTVNGTYTPQVLGSGLNDSILWLGPGTATDALWADIACCGLTSLRTDPVNGTRAFPTSGESGWGYVYDPNGPDKGYLGGTIITSLDPDQGPGARPFVGDFDGDASPDVLFYRPGTGREAIGYAGNTLT